MPCVSRFRGITIYQYANDHDPPHFHAKYAGQDVALVIDSLVVLAGRLPPRVLGSVREWAAMHQAELSENWDHLAAGLPPRQIDPLP